MPIAARNQLFFKLIMPPLHSRLPSRHRVALGIAAIPLARPSCLVVFIGIVFTFLGGSPAARAEGEPAENFIKQLRAAGYYDLTIRYLDRLSEFPGVGSDMMAAVPLEKAQTYIDAAIASRTATERDEQFAQAQAALQSFLKEHASHDRASEAKSQLGKLGMVRAAQVMSGDVDDAARVKARGLYQDAAKTFDEIIADLKAKLEGMKGARIDPNKEPEKAAKRDQSRFEYLLAKQNAGEARLMAAETYPDPAKGGKKLLVEALELYVDLSEKYDKFVQGATAFYPRGKVEKTLGQRDQAIESFTRMLEQSDADELREAKIGATIGLMQFALGEKPSNYAEAIKQGAPLEKTLRPNERRLPISQELRLELARAYVAKSKDDKKTNANERKRATTDARKLLLEAKKVAGPHIEATEEVLKSMGIDTSATAEVAELPTADDPKNLDEAILSGRTLIQTTQTLREQLKTLQDQKAPADKIKEIEDSMIKARRTGIVILRRGLSMINSESDSGQINMARQFLVSLLNEDEQYREGFVVGRYLARNAPGVDAGLYGGLVALGSAQRIIASDESLTDRWMIELQELGEYLTKTWPEDPKAASAQTIMVQLALGGGKIEKAQSLIDDMADGAEKAASQRVLGVLLWNESGKARVEEKLDEAEKLRALSATYLKRGLDGISGGLVASDSVVAALVLAKSFLMQDKPDDAVKILDHPKYGPIKAIEKLDSPDESLLADIYQTELRAVIGQMTTSQGSNEKLLERASAAIDKLRGAMKGEDAQKKLVTTFRSLASDIREQLEQAPPARKAKLIDAFNVFLARIAEITNDEATLQWVGQTMMEMADASMKPGERKAQGQAADMLQTSVKTFESLKARPDSELTVRFLLGKAYRLLGEYSKALNEFQAILTEKPTMLDAQIQAALAYEQWAADLKPAFAEKAYASAVGGARKGADNKNIIWGWGRVSQMAQRYPQFKEQFFESRYHIALCRFLQGQAKKDKSVVERAINDITSLTVLYPDMGGPEQRNKFDALLKKIQQAAGQPPKGLPPLPAAG